MRKVFGALFALATIFGGLSAGTPKVSAAGNYIVSINDATAPEGSPVTFTISLQQVLQSGDTITVTASTAGGTALQDTTCSANTDHIQRSDTVTLTANEPTGTFAVQTCQDQLTEGSETFTVQLSEPMANCGTDTPCSVTTGDPSGLGTITDDEAAATPTPTPTPTGSPNPPPVLQPTTLVVVDAVGRAGPGDNCRFSVNRLGDPSTLVRVAFASTGKINKVTNVAGTLVFGPGETTKTVDVDVLRRPRRQKFVTLTLSNATNALITDAIGLCELKTKRR